MPEWVPPPLRHLHANERTGYGKPKIEILQSHVATYLPRTRIWRRTGSAEAGALRRRQIVNSVTAVAKCPTHATTEINGNYAEWLGNPEAEYTLLYLHGGGYIMGGPDTHRNMVRALARYANVRALLLDYRLAPENPFPQPLKTPKPPMTGCLNKAWRRRKCLSPVTVPAGPKPRADVAIESTWQNPAQSGGFIVAMDDLTASGESARTRAERDPMIDINRMPEAIAYYCERHPADDPLISPVFADLSDLAPLFVQVGTEEVLFDDATRLVERAEAAGTKAELQIWDDMRMCIKLPFAMVPEARAALKDIARFFKGAMA